MTWRDDWQRLSPWWQSLQTERPAMALGWALMLVTAFAGMGLLGISGWFITACAVVTGALNVFTPGAAIRGFALIRTLARYGERLATHDVVLRVQNHWRMILFGGLLRRSLNQSDTLRHSHILQRLTQDLSAMDDLYLRIIAPVSVALLSATFVTVLTLLWLPLQIALLIPGLLILSLLVCAFSLPILRRSQRLELTASEQLRDSALSVSRGQAERYAWGLGESALNTLQQHTAGLATVTGAGRRQEQRLAVITETFLHGIFLLTLAVALYAMQQGLLNAPVAALLGFVVLGMTDIWLMIATATVSSARVLEAAKRLETDVQNARLPVDSHVAVSIKPPSVSIERAVIAGREQTLPWNIELQAGELHWLTDPSGRGKSTLAYLLAGELELADGKLHWSHPTKVSFLTQYNAVLAASVRDNLLMSSDLPETELWSILQAVELAEVIEGLPDGLDTWLGDGGYQLSGGQMRRLCLARALVRPAGLLILDEPFSSIDPQQARRIFAAIRPWIDGKTTLVISHTVL